MQSSWLARKTADTHILVLLAVSVAVTIVWALTRPMTFTTDFTTYVLLAEFLVGVHGAVPPIVFIRPPGYPFLMIICGVVAFRTFAGILVLQALMAIFIPLIAYTTVARYSKAIGFAAGLLITLSLMPQIHSRAIMTEQSFIFAFVVFAYFMVRYAFERSPRMFWSLVATALSMALLRPSANLFGYLVIAASLLIEPRTWRRALAASLLMFFVLGLWSSFVAGKIDNPVRGNLISRIFTWSPSFAGQQLFYDAYVVGQYTPPPGVTERRLAFSADNGPASERLLQTLTTFAEKYPQFWKTHPLAHPGDDANAFVEGLRTRPSEMAFGYMWSATDTMLGPAESSKLFMAVALEAFAARPSIALGLVDNFVSVLFGPMAEYSEGGRLVMIPTISAVTFKDPGLGTMSDSVRPHLAFPDLAPLWESVTASHLYGFGYVVLKPLLSLTVVGSLLFILCGPMWWPGLVLTASILLHHAITAVFAEHHIRYVDQVLPVTVILAAMGIVAARAGIRSLRDGLKRQAPDDMPDR